MIIPMGQLERPFLKRLPLPLDVLSRHSHHPSAALALNAMTQHFEVPGIEGFIAFRRAGRCWFQIGSPVAPRSDHPALVEAFCAAARRGRCRVVALQLRREDLGVAGEAGFRVNQLGMSYSLGLEGFSLAGTRFMKLRNKIKRAGKAGVEVFELGVDAPRDGAAWGRLDAITAAWLADKGRGAKLLEFMIGELGTPDQKWRRVFVGVREGRTVGFVSFVPAFGRAQGWMHDLSRRSPDAPPGVMERICAHALGIFESEGAAHLHFGLTPFVGVGPEHDTGPGRSPMVSKLIRLLAERGGAIYPARSQVQYKRKWRPDFVEPEYMAFQGRLRLADLWSLLRMTRAL